MKNEIMIKKLTQRVTGYGVKYSINLQNLGTIKFF